MAPTVILATNRGMSLVRGTDDIVSPHGVPVDLLDRYADFFSLTYTLLFIIAFVRCMIVKTDAYTREQIAKVVQMRANVEGLKLGPEVLDKLSAEGEKSSLR